MDVPNPEMVTIKIEPWSQEECSGEMTFTDTEIRLPDVKKECLQYAESAQPTIETNRHHTTRNHSSAKDVPNPEIVSIKTEQWSQEEGSGEMTFTDIEIHPPDVKKECLPYAESVQPTVSINVETVPIKAEPGSRETGEKDGRRIPHSEVDIDLPDVKKESLEHHGSITPDSKTDVKTHPGEKPYSCSYCNYSCSHKSHFTVHLRTHTGEKPYSCSYCSYSCSQKGTLKIHILTHTGEKPFSCSYCSFSCSQKRALNSHILIHTGEKPHTCPHCNYSCSDKSRLTAHLRTHTGEKPYSCPHCKYSCSRKTYLTVHLRTHTGIKPYSCSYCSYSCTQSQNLKIHILTHTG